MFIFVQIRMAPLGIVGEAFVQPVFHVTARVLSIAAMCVPVYSGLNGYALVFLSSRNLNQVGAVTIEWKPTSVINQASISLGLAILFDLTTVLAFGAVMITLRAKIAYIFTDNPEVSVWARPFI